jgi:hypothetical protein
MNHGQETIEAIKNMEPWTEELRNWNQPELEPMKAAWERAGALMPASIAHPAVLEASQPTFPPQPTIELTCTGRHHTIV